MSRIEFQDELNTPSVRNHVPQKKSGSISKILISHGIAKNESAAAAIMLGITVLCICIIIFMMTRSNTQNDVQFDASIDPETGLEFGVPPAI